MTDRIEDGGPAGCSIICASCNGVGIVQDGNRWDPSPEECSGCSGSGSNWLYPRGAIARYYGGPMVGRARQMGVQTGRAAHG